MTDSRPVRTILLVAVVATIAALLVTASWEISRDRIDANRRARLLESLESVLAPDMRDRDLDPILIDAHDPALLGDDEPVDVFVPMQGDSPVAAIFTSVAPNGYNAPIRLLVGIAVPSGQVTGVRVVEHRETPGLGDLIEIRKSPWILQFDGRSLGDPPAAGWAVTSEEGVFDGITSATVSSRAVIRAVHDTLRYFEANRDALVDRARRAAMDREPE